MLRNFVLKFVLQFVLQFVLAAAAAALCIVSASAQSPGGGQPSQSSLGIPLKVDKPLTEEEIERRKAADRAYEAAMHKIPDKKPSADPWGDVRAPSPVKKKQQ